MYLFINPNPPCVVSHVKENHLDTLVNTYPSEHIDVLILLQAPNLCVYSIRESNSLVKILETLFLLNHSTIHFCVVCHTKDSNEYP